MSVRRRTSVPNARPPVSTGYVPSLAGLDLNARNAPAPRSSNAEARRLLRRGASTGAGADGMDEDEAEDLLDGDRVVLQNLQSKPELNGTQGTVVRFDDDSGRYLVQLPGSEARLSLKRANLRRGEARDTRFDFPQELEPSQVCPSPGPSDPSPGPSDPAAVKREEQARAAKVLDLQARARELEGEAQAARDFIAEQQKKQVVAKKEEARLDSQLDAARKRESMERAEAREAQQDADEAARDSDLADQNASRVRTAEATSAAKREREEEAEAERNSVRQRKELTDAEALVKALEDELRKVIASEDIRLSSMSAAAKKASLAVRDQLKIQRQVVNEQKKTVQAADAKLKGLVKEFGTLRKQREEEAEAKEKQQEEMRERCLELEAKMHRLRYEAYHMGDDFKKLMEKWEEEECDEVLYDTARREEGKPPLGTPVWFAQLAEMLKQLEESMLDAEKGDEKGWQVLGDDDDYWKREQNEDDFPALGAKGKAELQKIRDSDEYDFLHMQYAQEYIDEREENPRVGQTELTEEETARSTLEKAFALQGAEDMEGEEGMDLDDKLKGEDFVQVDFRMRVINTGDDTEEKVAARIDVVHANLENSEASVIGRILAARRRKEEERKRENNQRQKRGERPLEGVDVVDEADVEEARTKREYKPTTLAIPGFVDVVNHEVRQVEEYVTRVLRGAPGVPPLSPFTLESVAAYPQSAYEAPWVSQMNQPASPGNHMTLWAVSFNIPGNTKESRSIANQLLDHCFKVTPQQWSTGTGLTVTQVNGLPDRKRYFDAQARLEQLKSTDPPTVFEMEYLDEVYGKEWRLYRAEDALQVLKQVRREWLEADMAELAQQGKMRCVADDAESEATVNREDGKEITTYTEGMDEHGKRPSNSRKSSAPVRNAAAAGAGGSSGAGGGSGDDPMVR